MRWLGDEEDVWGFIFAAAKIVLIVVLAAGYCDTSSQVNALEARVKDLSARLEAHASEGRNILVSGKVELVHGRPGAHDKGCDADGARAVVFDDEDGVAKGAGVIDEEPDARLGASHGAVQTRTSSGRGEEHENQQGDHWRLCSIRRARACAGGVRVGWLFIWLQVVGRLLLCKAGAVRQEAG